VCCEGSAKTVIPYNKWVFCSRPQLCGSDNNSEMNADSFKDFFVKGSTVT
jgi:hypothetical protein